MSPKVLNRAVKRLAEDIKSGKIEPLSIPAKNEFNRLYGADSSLKSLSAQSLLIMLVLNSRYNYIKWHYFAPAEY